MGRDFLGKFNVSGDLTFARGILLLDDMEGTDFWEAEGTGADFSVALDTASGFFGKNGMHLKTRVTTPADGDFCRAKRYIPFPTNDLFIVRARIGIPDISIVEHVRILVQFYRANRSRIAGIEIHPNTPDLRYQDDAANWVAVSGYDQVLVDGVWLITEMGLDLSTGKYIYVENNGIRTPFTSDFFDSADAIGYRYCQLSFYVEANGANAAEAYVDSVYAGQYLDI